MLSKQFQSDTIIMILNSNDFKRTYLNPFNRFSQFVMNNFTICDE